jgi:excisionase family DNA binding protein
MKRKSYRDNIADNLAGMQPLTVTVPQASAMINKSPRTIYELMATGELQAVKSGRNTLIVYDSLRQYVSKLPPVNIKPYIRPVNKCELADHR